MLHVDVGAATEQARQGKLGLAVWVRGSGAGQPQLVGDFTK